MTTKKIASANEVFFVKWSLINGIWNNFQDGTQNLEEYNM